MKYIKVIPLLNGINKINIAGFQGIILRDVFPLISLIIADLK